MSRKFKVEMIIEFDNEDTILSTSEQHWPDDVQDHLQQIMDTHEIEVHDVDVYETIDEVL